MVVSSAVAVINATGSASAASAWGYHWGLYDQEVDPEGQVFRWTGDSALLTLSVAPEVQSIELSYQVSPPIRDGAPTEVTIHVGDTTQRFTVREPGWHDAIFPLERSGNSHQTVFVEVTVSPIMVPAAMGTSTDSRRLGATLRPPRYGDR